MINSIDASEARQGAGAARMVDALIGLSPEQIAASIGMPYNALIAHWAASPISSAGRLSCAIRIIIDCYRDSSGTEQPAAAETVQSAANLGTLVDEYMALRAAWDSRDVFLLTGPALWQTSDACAVVAAPSTDIEPVIVTRSSHRRALLVDDSSDILIVVGAFLTDFGFAVEYAGNAETALTILAEKPPFDLLVTDHAMPGMTGKDLLAEACERNPRLQGLIITGYADCAELANLPSGVTLLAKPFRRDQLYKLVFPSIEHPAGLDPAATQQESVSV